MRIVCILLLCLAVILHSIGLSSQSKGLPEYGRNPGFHHSGPSSSSLGRHRPDTTNSSANPYHSTRSPPTTEPPLRHRSRSPSLGQTFTSVLGFRFEDLALIRLIPHKNPNQVFELRRYVFPRDEPIRLRTKNRALHPMPTGVQIVLSTSDDDVCAILGKSLSRNISLRPMYANISGVSKRVKININTGSIEGLTTEEIARCPVTSRESITKSYRVLRLSPESQNLPDGAPLPDVYHREPYSPSTGRHSPAMTHPHATPHPYPRSSPSAGPPVRQRSRSPNPRQIFHTVLGFRFEELESIRLIPRNYPNRIFELRRYVFPPNKLIGLKTKNRILDPMPTGEQIVISTSNGDVCAILGKSSSRNTSLRPIFSYVLGISKRVKININSGVVEELTTQEIAECRVTAGESITKSYETSRV